MAAAGKWVPVKYGDGGRGWAIPKRVHFLLSMAELVNCLAAAVVDEEELPDRMSDNEVRRRINQLLYDKGVQGYAYWRDDWDDEKADLMLEWATRQCRRVYGNLPKADG